MKKNLIFFLSLLLFFISFSLKGNEYGNDIQIKIIEFDLYFGDMNKNIILDSGENFMIVHNEEPFSYYIMSKSFKNTCSITNQLSNKDNQNRNNLFFVYPLGVYTSYFSCRNSEKEIYYSENFIFSLHNKNYDRIIELEKKAESIRKQKKSSKIVDQVFDLCNKLNLQKNEVFFEKCLLTHSSKLFY